MVNVHPTMKRKLPDSPRPCGAQVRAQRKFAQSILLGNAAAHLGKRTSDSCTPSPPPVAAKPKTEDFINFLCYRGTPALPPTLTFFNYATMREEEIKSRRINEQEAKFAMTALKLKYQEKRLSIVSTLAKKVKERRVILTRSRITSRPDEVKMKSISKPIERKSEPEPVRSRNAPSPDIIDGVHHNSSPTKVETKRDTQSEKKPAESARPKKAKVTPEPEVRVSRLEKITTSSSSERRVAAKPKFLPTRVTTRALRKENSTPLHELPMIKKSLPKPAQKERSNDKTSKTEKYSRPTRKTKETATIYLGLINKDFSSDDEMPDEPKEEDDSGSDTSSSETKFLEKQYNASLKRDESSKIQNARERQKKLDRKKQKKEAEEKKEKKRKDIKEAKAKSKSKPEKRVLRSHSNSNSTSTASSSSKYSNLRSRRGSESEAIERRHSGAGAARKSAIACRAKLKPNSSSSSDSSSSSKEEEDESEQQASNKSDDEDEDVKQEEVHKDGSDEDEDEDQKSIAGSTEDADDSHATDEESEQDMSPEAATAETATEITEEQEDEDDSQAHEVRASPSRRKGRESFSDGELSKDIVVEKVSIAIQVDMDLDEEAEPQIHSSPSVTQTQTQREHGTQASSTSNGSMTRRSPPQIPLFSHLNLQPNLSQSQHQYHVHHQQHQQVMPTHSGHSHITIPRPIIPEMPVPPPPTSLMSEVLHQQHCSISSTMQPPTVLSFNSMTSFSPYTISHPMLPFGCVTDAASSSLDTHIRTVAANLDIRLVRPSMAQGGLSPFPFTSTLPFPALPFAKPMSMTPDPNSLPFYSGFRAPFSTYTARTFTPMAATYQTLQTTAIHTSHTPITPMPPMNLQPQQQQQQPSQPRQGHMHGQGQDLSLIQHLPNVSIVPRFDRNSKVVILPNASRKPGSSQSASNGQTEKPSTSSSSNSKTSRNNSSDKSKKKEGSGNGSGRKPKQQQSGLPPPSSPLTVRKDSITPATYSGSTSKKNSSSSSRKK